ncbi:MAG: 5-formyltetrahydrofolate cyclo-ligase [Pseudomonadales bacterium]
MPPSPVNTLSAASRRELRRHFRAQRRDLSDNDQREHARAATRHALASGLFWGARTVAIYLPADGELSPLPLAVQLTKQRVTITLPVVTESPGRGPHLLFRRWRPGDRLIPNRYGIPEPETSAPLVNLLRHDRLVVPLVAFDDAGSRLGMGAGFYDRTLSALPPRLRPNLIGYAHGLQKSAHALPRAEWDIPLDSVVTETGITLFRSNGTKTMVV